MEQEKRFYRQLKKVLKRDGTKRRRKALKQQLAENPDEAPYVEYDFGRDGTTHLNGLFRPAGDQGDPESRLHS
jgi:hypothetical protein